VLSSDIEAINTLNTTSHLPQFKSFKNFTLTKDT